MEVWRQGLIGKMIGLISIGGGLGEGLGGSQDAAL